MATWNPQYTAPENVNGGNDFNGQNGVNATDMNACFNNAFYAAQQASNAVTTASNAVSTASGAVTTANAALSKANEAIEKAEDAVVGVATTTELGGIKIGYSENGNNYPVELDSNNRAFVNVPSSKSTLTIESGDESYSFSESDTTQKLSFSGCSLNSFSLGAGERTISVNFNRMAGTTLEGLVKLTTTGHQSVAANSISSTAGRTYAVQYNNDQQLVVNVPWTDTDTNTTYSAGTGLSLSGTTFSANVGDGLYVNDNQITLRAADSNTYGGIKTGYVDTDTTRRYGVRLDGGKAYVLVPWTDTTYDVMTGASNGNPGTSGLVPAPTGSMGSSHFLCANGQWTTVPIPTQSYIFDWNTMGSTPHYLVAATGSGTNDLGIWMPYFNKYGLYSITPPNVGASNYNSCYVPTCEWVLNNLPEAAQGTKGVAEIYVDGTVLYINT